mgnify:CR=1 FL=1
MCVSLSCWLLLIKWEGGKEWNKCVEGVLCETCKATLFLLRKKSAQGKIGVNKEKMMIASYLSLQKVLATPNF